MWATRKKIEQVLLTNQVLCLTQKIILAQTIVHQKKDAQPWGGKKFHASDNRPNPSPPPLKDIMVLP